MTLTNDELQAIRARAEAATFFTCDDPDFTCTFRSDIPALLSHIEHQRNALEWLAEQAAYTCSHATGCPAPYQVCPRGNTRCLDIEGEDWIRKALDATREATSE